MGEARITRRNFMGAAAVAGVAAMGAGLAGCGSNAASASASGAGSSSAATASKAAKPVILVVSFGTSYNDSRHITIGAIENDIAEAFPDYDVRRAFTAQIIIDKLAERDGRKIDNIEEALARCIEDGVTELIVQPTHLMPGFEYQDVVAAVDEVKDQFSKVAVGEPLLTSDADFDKVIDALKAMSEPYNDGETGFVFMGHGTEADSNEVYAELQEKIGKGSPYIITTVEAEPTFDDALAALELLGYKKAVLRPLMVVAGDHANNDMADLEDPESLASILTAAGVQVTSVLEGLGQNVEIDEIYVEHVEAAIKDAK